MRFIIDQMRRARQREDGFTLIELLIVILILGILAGIAVFASGPFRDKATAACQDANTEIGIVANAATDAGVTGDLYAQGPGDCAGTGGSGGTTSTTAAVAAPTGTVSISSSGGNSITADVSGINGSPNPTFSYSWERAFDPSGGCTSSGYGDFGGSSSTSTQTSTSNLYCYHVTVTATNGVDPDLVTTSNNVRGG